MALRIGFLATELERMGEPSMAVCLQRPHAQFFGKRQVCAQPSPCIVWASTVEVNLTEHSQRISLVRPLSVFAGEFEGARGRLQCIGLPAQG